MFRPWHLDLAIDVALDVPGGPLAFSPGRWHNLAATAWKMTETRETTAGAPLLWVRI